VKLHPVAAGALALAVTAVCVAAGSWQLSKYFARRALVEARADALAAAAEPLATSEQGLSRQAGRKVVAEGAFDESRHVLLSARFHEADLGVEVLTPLFTPGGTALLVHRGWLRAEDGQTAHPESLPEPGARRVTGVLERLPAREGMPEWRRLETAGAEHWSTHEADSASVAKYLPYRLAPWVLVALPEPGEPSRFARTGPALPDPQVHLSYAIQWFAFALVTVIGSIVLALRGRKARPGGAAARP
jgi:cytochrome oxidase assembly protein ShyY1